LTVAPERVATQAPAGEVVWRLAGTGPALLLIHGGAGSWTHWQRAIPHLSQDHRLLMPDLPGFGESGVPPEGGDGASRAEVLAEAVMDGLRLLLPDEAPVTVAGFSFGSLIAGLVSERLGRRLCRLVLVGPGGLGLPGSLRLGLRRWRGIDNPAARRAIHRHNLATLMIADPTCIDEETLALQTANAEAARLDSRPISALPVLRDCLWRARPPLAAIWGERDAVALHAMDERIAILREIVPDCAVEIVPRAGHWVAHEQPLAFAAALRRIMAACAADYPRQARSSCP
jgi:2-hydroxy-6-oxonona-2,4-dienedioate hydrolase